MTKRISALLLLVVSVALGQNVSGGGTANVAGACGSPNCTVSGNLTVSGTTTMGATVPLPSGAPVGSLNVGGAIQTPGNVAVIDPYLYGVKADAKMVRDASITNGSNVVTCPNSDCGFTSADVGKTVFVGCGVTSACTFKLGETTITAVTNANSIIVGANAAATQTGTSWLTWGTIDNSASNPALQNAWNAFAARLAVGPAILKLPAGSMLVEAGIASNPSINPIFQPTIEGYGASATVLIPTPNFTWTKTANTGVPTCASDNTCFFGGLTINNSTAWIQFRDFTILGLGNNANCPSSGTWNILSYPLSTIAENVNVVNWCLTGNGATAVRALLTQGNVQIYNMDIWATGYPDSVQVLVGNIPLEIVGSAIGGSTSNLHANGTGIINSTSNTYLATSRSITLDSTATVFNSFGEIIDGINIGSGATANTFNTTINCASCAGFGVVYFNGGGTLRLNNNSPVTPSGATQRAFGGSNGTIISDGSNVFTAGTVDLSVSSNAFISDAHTLYGVCTGTATASQTLGLYATGPNVTATTCTSTTVGSGIPITRAATLEFLQVSATAGGVSGSAGVVTVLKNGSATALTCTLGTATSCVDYTHTVSFAAGDLMSLQFTTQGSETLAGVKVAALWQ